MNRIPVAKRRSDGKEATVEEVERGLAADVLCYGCNEPLVARKGDIKRHHFAHQSKSADRKCGESWLHKYAKDWFVKHMPGKRLPFQYPGKHPGREWDVLRVAPDPKQFPEYDDVDLELYRPPRTEVWIDTWGKFEVGRRVDVWTGGSYNERKDEYWDIESGVAIEFKYSNGKDIAYINQMADAGVSAIELDLKGFIQDWKARGDESFPVAFKRWMLHSRKHKRLLVTLAVGSMGEAVYPWMYDDMWANDSVLWTYGPGHSRDGTRKECSKCRKNQHDVEYKICYECKNRQWIEYARQRDQAEEERREAELAPAIAEAREIVISKIRDMTIGERKHVLLPGFRNTFLLPNKPAATGVMLDLPTMSKSRTIDVGLRGHLLDKYHGTKILERNFLLAIEVRTNADGKDDGYVPDMEAANISVLELDVRSFIKEQVSRGRIELVRQIGWYESLIEKWVKTQSSHKRWLVSPASHILRTEGKSE